MLCFSNPKVNGEYRNRNQPLHDRPTYLNASSNLVLWFAPSATYWMISKAGKVNTDEAYACVNDPAKDPVNIRASWFSFDKSLSKFQIDSKARIFAVEEAVHLTKFSIKSLNGIYIWNGYQCHRNRLVYRSEEGQLMLYYNDKDREWTVEKMDRTGPLAVSEKTDCQHMELPKLKWQVYDFILKKRIADPEARVTNDFVQHRKAVREILKQFDEGSLHSVQTKNLARGCFADFDIAEAMLSWVEDYENDILQESINFSTFYSYHGFGYYHFEYADLIEYHQVKKNKEVWCILKDGFLFFYPRPVEKNVSPYSLASKRKEPPQVGIEFHKLKECWPLTDCSADRRGIMGMEIITGSEKLKVHGIDPENQRSWRKAILGSVHSNHQHYLICKRLIEETERLNIRIRLRVSTWLFGALSDLVERARHSWRYTDKLFSKLQIHSGQLKDLVNSLRREKNDKSFRDERELSTSSARSSKKRQGKSKEHDARAVTEYIYNTREESSIPGEAVSMLVDIWSRVQTLEKETQKTDAHLKLLESELGEQDDDNVNVLLSHLKNKIERTRQDADSFRGKIGDQLIRNSKRMERVSSAGSSGDINLARNTNSFFSVRTEEKGYTEAKEATRTLMLNLDQEFYRLPHVYSNLETLMRYFDLTPEEEVKSPALDVRPPRFSGGSNS